MPRNPVLRLWPELTVALLLTAALVLVLVRQGGERTEALERAREQQAQASQVAARQGTPSGTQAAALLSFPPAEPASGRALTAALGPERLLDARHLAPLVVAWYAGVAPASLDRPTALLLAASTARVLGSEEGVRYSVSGFAEQSLAGLESLRAALEARCGDCAPPPGALPTAELPLPPSLRGERVARSASPQATADSELGQLVASVRRGGQVPAETWQRAGFCGMAALELARAGRVEALDSLLEAAVSGPTAMDRIAALHAAMSLEEPDTWPEGPARERALAVRYELESGSR